MVIVSWEIEYIPFVSCQIQALAHYTKVCEWTFRDNYFRMPVFLFFLVRGRLFYFLILSPTRIKLTFDPVTITKELFFMYAFHTYLSCCRLGSPNPRVAMGHATQITGPILQSLQIFIGVPIANYSIEKYETLRKITWNKLTEH